MKRTTVLCMLAVLVCLLLCACGQSVSVPKIQVSLVENGDFTVEENGIWIYPGQRATFTLRLRSGTELIGTDYDGAYYIWNDNGAVKLELRDVAYPTRVSLEITSYARRITYDPNGGEGKTVSLHYNISLHTRPNTSIGTDRYSREGYTLTSWNTEPDGSGTRVGLGSRITVPQSGMTLYAQWAQWADPSCFTRTVTDGAVTVTGYSGSDETLVIPEYLDGLPVTCIAAGAFAGCGADTVILPKSILEIENGAFDGAAMTSLLLYDNIESFSDDSFRNCGSLRTLYINAIEAPYGYAFRRESMYADKVDMLIDAQGQKKAVFYAGCSMWYNLNGDTVQNALEDYVVINAATNGTVNAYVQMQILSHYLEEGDIFFHTPELTSDQQFLTATDMARNDDKLWCGLEYNYDLFALVDIRGIAGVFDTFQTYLSKKTAATDYTGQYKDSDGNVYLDATGSLPFQRVGHHEELAEAEAVALDPEALGSRDLSLLEAFYDDFAARGVHVYVSYACVDLTHVPEDQKDNVAAVHQLLSDTFAEMESPVLISTLWDYLYDAEEFYNSSYHLLSTAVETNTARWLRDLKAQMLLDGLLNTD